MNISEIKSRIQSANLALTNGLLDESTKLFYEIVTIQSCDTDIFSDLIFLLIKIVSCKFNLNLNVTRGYCLTLYYNTSYERSFTLPEINNDLSDLKKSINLDSWILKVKLFKIIHYIDTWDSIDWTNDYPGAKWGPTWEKFNDLGVKSYNKKTTVNFGKYKGLSVDEIILKNPGLLIWYHDNLTHFYLTWDVILDINFINRAGDNYFEFIKRFIFKDSVFTKLSNLFMEDIETNRAACEYEGSQNRYYDSSSKEAYFNAMTDGQLGSYEEFEGDIDNIDDWAGR